MECGAKLYGPKRQARLEAFAAALTQNEPLTVISSSVSPVTDVGLSNRELFYIRALHLQHSSNKLSACTSVILQNLWKEYGDIFQNQALLYSVMAWATSFDCQGVTHVERLDDHYHYKQRMYQVVRSDIASENNISECHFFAILFAILTSFHELRGENIRQFNGNNPELRYHQHAFFNVLKVLNARAQVYQGPLQYLYHYAVSLIRLWSSEGSEADLNYKMHRAAEEIPLPSVVPDLRATFALPAQFWLRQNQAPNWQGVEWSLSDDVRALHSCFQVMLVSNPDFEVEKVYNHQIAHSIQYLREKVSDMKRLPAVNGIFQSV